MTTTNERIRNIYTESLPFGREIVDAIDDRSLKSLGAAPGQVRVPEDDALKKARQKAQENARLAAQRKAEEAKAAQVSAQSAARNKVEQAISAVKGEPAKSRAGGRAAADASSVPSSPSASPSKAAATSTPANSFNDKASQAAQQASQSLNEAGNALSAKTAPVAEKAKDVVNETLDSTKRLIDQAEKALGLSVGKMESSVTEMSQPAISQKPKSKGPNRELDPTPLPEPEPYGQPYTGPPLPLGFEPPPGYYIPKKKRPSTDGKSSRPEPLPLIAPQVSKLDGASKEPILGQLAGTIDSLASYVGSVAPERASDKVKGVLSAAEGDLKRLSDRLDAIKASEHEKLQARLDEQQRTYTAQISSKEKELFDRLEAQESDWQAAFESERKNLVASYRAKLDKELATQKEIIDQRLKEEVIAQGIDMQRRWLKDVKQKVEEERGGRLAKLDQLHTDLQKLSKVTMDNDSYLEESLKVTRLFSTLKVAQEAEGRPMANELRALQELSGNEPTIIAALSSIPNESIQNGIKPLSYLSAWFSNAVSSRIKAAALMPDHGGFLSYATSAILSPLLFTRTGPTEGDDVMSVLSRAQHFLDLKDVGSAAREINQLKGWPKILARDWLEACRRHCEVKQALKVSFISFVFNNHCGRSKLSSSHSDYRK